MNRNSVVKGTVVLVDIPYLDSAQGSWRATAKFHAVQTLPGLKRANRKKGDRRWNRVKLGTDDGASGHIRKYRLSGLVAKSNYIPSHVLVAGRSRVARLAIGR